MQDLSSVEQIMIWSVFGISIVSLFYALFLRSQIMAKSKGTEKMQEVWSFIRVGANAYLNTQIRTIVATVFILVVALAASVLLVKPTPDAIEHFCRAAVEALGEGATLGQISRLDCPQATTWVAVGRSSAFFMGALFSTSVGFIGMNMAIQGNVRVAAAAIDEKRGYAEALQIAYRSGTITGMLTDGLGLLGGTIIFIIFGRAAPDALLGFGFGGTLIAMFMRVGGGIFTKAADVGADLVGKIEAGLPEDDPRNAAVIADLVGDNVGDCAGMASDIFESYEVTIVSGLILGLALSRLTGTLIWIIFPLAVRGIGVFSSIIGTYFVRSSGEDEDATKAIFRGFFVSAVITVIAFSILSFFYMRETPFGNLGDFSGNILIWRPAAAAFVGIVLAIVIDRLTEYFTSWHFPPVSEIARSTQTGSATTILAGLAEGYESSVWAVLVIAGSILASVVIYAGVGTTVTEQFTYVLYGVAMTGIGMLTLTGNNVSMDAFGPISDNAQGISELSGEAENAGNRLERLDAAGNTTKAITKGVAIGSAVIAAVSLFGAFMTDTQIVQEALNVPKEEWLSTIGINLANPLVFIGLLIGGSLPLLFASLMIKAVSRAAFEMINEVRRQLRIPGIMEGTKTPDYAIAVGISTRAAQRELLPLGLIAVLTPIVVGFLLGAQALGGFLGGIILSGQLLAVFMSNTGGAWDNAKKYVEDGNYGGKGSPAHEAGIVGDTVGDPLKDTAGPALNPMIKVVNLVSLIIAPLVVAVRVNSSGQAQGLPVGLVIAMVVLLAIIAYSIWTSKRQRETTDEVYASVATGTD